MSFVIDNAKVEELLASSHMSYEVSSSSVAVAIENSTPIPLYPSLPAGGMTPTGTREHLLALRRKIEASGIPLISPDELESEVREMRR
jgi:hypothetical protein